jgi:hypothetical protein
VFPAINGNYQYLPPGLKKDDQGFYTSITPLTISYPSRFFSTFLAAVIDVPPAVLV